MEVMLNTKLVSELIEKSDFIGVKDAMDNSIAEGSQTFEEDLARLIVTGKIERQEGLANADSPTNLLWRLQNDVERYNANRAQQPDDEGKPGDGASFTEITLDVRPSEFGHPDFQKSKVGSLSDSRLGGL
jgi:twitching motility protein PilU